MRRIRTYVVAALVMLALDLVWLGLISPPLYRAAIGPLLRARPDLLPAVLFYAVYLVGVNEFVIHALPPGTPMSRVIGRGALFGFVAYSTFDLTALALLAGWSPLVTVVDLAWGTLLTAIVAAVAYRAAGRQTA